MDKETGLLAAVIGLAIEDAHEVTFAPQRKRIRREIRALLRMISDCEKRLLWIRREEERAGLYYGSKGALLFVGGESAELMRSYRSAISMLAGEDASEALEGFAKRVGVKSAVLDAMARGEIVRLSRREVSLVATAYSMSEDSIARPVELSDVAHYLVDRSESLSGSLAEARAKLVSKQWLLYSEDCRNWCVLIDVDHGAICRIVRGLRSDHSRSLRADPLVDETLRALHRRTICP